MTTSIPIQGVTNPTNAQDVATKNYVDGYFQSYKYFNNYIDKIKEVLFPNVQDEFNEMKNVYEIFNEYEQATSKQERLDVLRRNSTWALKNVLKGTFDPNIKFITGNLDNDAHLHCMETVYGVRMIFDPTFKNIKDYQIIDKEKFTLFVLKWA